MKILITGARGFVDVFLLERLDLLLVALHHTGDQLFGIHAAGKARDDVIGAVAVDAGGTAGAAGQAADGCHRDCTSFLFSEAFCAVWMVH